MRDCGVDQREELRLGRHLVVEQALGYIYDLDQDLLDTLFQVYLLLEVHIPDVDLFGFFRLGVCVGERMGAAALLNTALVLAAARVVDSLADDLEDPAFKVLNFNYIGQAKNASLRCRVLRVV
mmetsp:Transcript_12274/g.19029  ORF Transcript_12274/g.19029 Transcript_12274/m.19029 type:complete len:123 (-) Transcript_12274:1323-1691(-)